jgi:hypothetical protein
VRTSVPITENVHTAAIFDIIEAVFSQIVCSRNTSTLKTTLTNPKPKIKAANIKSKLSSVFRENEKRSNVNYD